MSWPTHGETLFLQFPLRTYLPQCSAPKMTGLRERSPETLLWPLDIASSPILLEARFATEEMLRLQIRDVVIALAFLRFLCNEG